MPTIKTLMSSFPHAGTLEQILVRTKHRGSIENLEQTQAIAGVGLKGDHRQDKTANPEAKRQVTLIQAEHLEVVAKLLKKDSINPAETRRNLVVSGINLTALKDKQFQIGEAIFEGTGFCHPCSRMEENLGEGGYNAMRGHGGITARVLSTGSIKVGENVLALLG